MAIGWLTVLKLVPWTEVIKNAPAVAEGARKLWSSVGTKNPAPEAAPRSDVTAMPLPDDVPAVLSARLVEAETSVQQLQSQMQASSELIKALAEQNAELVRRVELNRSRVNWLIGLLLVVGVVAGLNLAVTLSAGG